MALLLWLIGGSVVLVGGLLIAGSFLPDDAMLVIPLPEGNGRKRLLPVGIAVIVLGLIVPPVGTAVQGPPITPTPTTTPTMTPTSTTIATDTPSPFPTIPIVPTVTPIPPTLTPSMTPTPSPVPPTLPPGRLADAGPGVS